MNELYSVIKTTFTNSRTRKLVTFLSAKGISTKIKAFFTISLTLLLTSCGKDEKPNNISPYQATGKGAFVTRCNQPLLITNSYVADIDIDLLTIQPLSDGVYEFDGCNVEVKDSRLVEQDDVLISGQTCEF